MPNKPPQSMSKASADEVAAMRARLASVDLKPGEMHVAETPTLISTVLGSCVSVCLYSPEARIGAMCHCILPSQLQANLHRGNPHCCVDTCVNDMLEDLAQRHKVSPKQLKAKLFGGATVLQAAAAGVDDAATIGHRNIEAARQALREHDLPLVSECVGGEQGYKVFFNTETGEVLLRRVKNSRIDAHELSAEHRQKN